MAPTTFHRWHLPFSGSQSLDDGRKFAYIIGKPIQVGADVFVTATVNLTQTPLRLVGINQQGNVIEGQSRSMAANQMRQISLLLPETDVASLHGFRIEERDYESVAITMSLFNATSIRMSKFTMR